MYAAPVASNDAATMPYCVVAVEEEPFNFDTDTPLGRLTITCWLPSIRDATPAASCA